MMEHSYNYNAAEVAKWSKFEAARTEKGLLRQGHFNLYIYMGKN